MAERTVNILAIDFEPIPTLHIKPDGVTHIIGRLAEKSVQEDNFLANTGAQIIAPEIVSRQQLPDGAVEMVVRIPPRK